MPRSNLFIGAQDLFDEMYASLADRASRKLIDRLARVDVLLIDAMGYLNLKPEQTTISFAWTEERYRDKPTIIHKDLIASVLRPCTSPCRARCAHVDSPSGMRFTERIRKYAPPF